jgi:hypothetical protein
MLLRDLLGCVRYNMRFLGARDWLLCEAVNIALAMREIAQFVRAKAAAILHH